MNRMVLSIIAVVLTQLSYLHAQQSEQTAKETPCGLLIKAIIFLGDQNVIADSEKHQEFRQWYKRLTNIGVIEHCAKHKDIFVLIIERLIKEFNHPDQELAHTELKNLRKKIKFKIYEDRRNVYQHHRWFVSQYWNKEALKHGK